MTSEKCYNYKVIVEMLEQSCDAQTDPRFEELSRELEFSHG